MKKSIITSGLLALSLIFSGVAGAEDDMRPKPFDSAELEKFVKDYQAFTQWQSKDENSLTGDLSDPWVMAGMQFDEEFAASLKAKGWNPERYFYMLNHIRQGVREERARLRRMETEARINKQMAEMNAEIEARRAEFEKKSRQQAAKAKAWVNDQLEDQKRRVRENPYMHPMQKQVIMDFLNRSSAEAKSIDTPRANFQRNQAKAEAQQKMWENRYRHSIMHSPFIPPEQKRMIIEGLDQANQPANMEMPSQKEMMARMQEQRKSWVARQIEQVQKDAFYTDEQKKNIIERLQNFDNDARKETQRKPFSSLPQEEMALIKQNSVMLMEMLRRK